MSAPVGCDRQWKGSLIRSSGCWAASRSDFVELGSNGHAIRWPAYNRRDRLKAPERCGSVQASFWR